MMERRASIARITRLVSSLVATLAFSLVSTSLLAEAQQTGKVARLGWLLNGSSSPASPDSANRNAFLGQLRDLGYVEGQNLIIERRYAEGQMERHRGTGQRGTHDW